MPEMTVGTLIKQSRERLNISQYGLARELGVSRSAVYQWEANQASPDKTRITALSRILGIDAMLFLADKEGIPMASDPPLLPNPRSATIHPRQIPVYRTTEAIKAGEFVDFWLVGEIVNMITLPPRLISRSDVRALYIHSHRMEPRYFANEMVICGNIQPPVEGDFVVAVLKPKNDGERKPCMVRRLVGRKGEKLQLEQYNPHRVLSVSLSEIDQLLRIIPTSELT